jgi:methylase of polypeptide subunit release factors
VLDPVATKVGEWLAAQMAAEVRPGERWLDMGCGSGIVGLAMARVGAEVTCVDVDPEAVRCARANAALHDVRLEVLQGDLFEPVRDRRFHGVVYNVPFWPGPVDDRPFARALYAGPAFEAIHAFRDTWHAHAGRARVPLSRAGGDPAGAAAALGGTLLKSGRHRGEHIDLYGL